MNSRQIEKIFDLYEKYWDEWREENIRLKSWVECYAPKEYAPVIEAKKINALKETLNILGCALGFDLEDWFCEYQETEPKEEFLERLKEKYEK